MGACAWLRVLRTASVPVERRDPGARTVDMGTGLRSDARIVAIEAFDLVGATSEAGVLKG